MSAIEYDPIYWEEDGQGGIMPREAPLPLNYPATPDVRDGVLFGAFNEFLGEAFLAENPPPAPGLAVAAGETGFVATVTDVAETHFRGLRYRSTASEVWLYAPVFAIPADLPLGAGEIAVTDLEPGGYEVEAFAVAVTSFGPTSLRRFVQVAAGDDGDPVEAAKWIARLARSRDRLIYHGRNSVSATFDPTQAQAVQQTFDDTADLSALCTRGLPQEVTASSPGKYVVTDFIAYVLASDLDAYGLTPAPGDEATIQPGGERFAVIGQALRFHRTVWQLVLRKVP